MTKQTSLWQDEQQSPDFAELCNALYERELKQLTCIESTSVNALQGRLKSLPYYVKRTAQSMIQAGAPMNLDCQNASWSTKQSATMPLTGQTQDDIIHWYRNIKLTHGLVLPIALQDHIVLDCIDRVDTEHHRFRTNLYGWFTLPELANKHEDIRLLKPNKKVMMAACSGHRWQGKKKLTPVIPSLRELLLSCTINWRNLKQPKLSKSLN
mgnify:FL=1